MAHGAGTDGKIYRGLIKRRKDTETIEAEKKEKAAAELEAKKLLNMKWDHIGINSFSPNTDNFKRLYNSNLANRSAVTTTNQSYAKATGAADPQVAQNYDLPRG